MTAVDQPTTEPREAAQAVAMLLRYHSCRVVHEHPNVVTVFGCRSCAWQGDGPSVATHHAQVLAAAGLLAPAPQPAADTEPSTTSGTFSLNP